MSLCKSTAFSCINNIVALCFMEFDVKFTDFSKKRVFSVDVFDVYD